MQRNTLIRATYLSLLWGSCILALASCAGTPSNDTASTARKDDGLFMFTEAQFQNADMQIGKMRVRDFYRMVHANGVLDVPPQNRASVSPYFEGYVKELELLPGDRVQKGQTLFVLENPDYIQTQKAYLEARGQLNYLKSNFERQKKLFRENAVSQKDYLKAEADYTVTRVTMESLKKKLLLMNINPHTLTLKNLRTTLPVSAPIPGYITHVNISKGVFLHPSDEALTIVDIGHIHLELGVFEKDLDAIAIGQPISFTMQNGQHKTYKAEVYLVNKSVDSKTRMAALHGHLLDERHTESFYPGRYVQAKIYTGARKAPSLPGEAVVKANGKHYVLLKVGATDGVFSFRKKEVDAGKIYNGYIEIKNYSAFGDSAEFMVKGAFQALAE